MTDKSDRVTESVAEALRVMTAAFAPYVENEAQAEALRIADAALEALTTRPQPGEDAVERAARALCELQIRRARRWDTPEEKLEATLPEAVDYAWRDFIEEARAALNAAALPVENPQ